MRGGGGIDAASRDTLQEIDKDGVMHNVLSRLNIRKTTIEELESKLKKMPGNKAGIIDTLLDTSYSELKSMKKWMINPNYRNTVESGSAYNGSKTSDTSTIAYESKEADVDADDVDVEDYENSEKITVFLLKRREIEEILVVEKWAASQGENIDWVNFTRESISKFRHEIPEKDLEEVLKKAIRVPELQDRLGQKRVTSISRFVQKPIAWFEKEFCNTATLSSSDVDEIEKFKAWCKYEYIGFLPVDWDQSYHIFCQFPPAQSELDLRHILRVLGLKADAVRSLKLRGVTDITWLKKISKNWKIDEKDGNRVATEAWKSIPLTKHEALEVVKFGQWYDFYVTGHKSAVHWQNDFNRVQFMGFVQRYDAGEDYKKPGEWAKSRDILKLSKEMKNFREHIDEVAESGKMTPGQRYHLQKYFEKKPLMDLVRTIKANEEDGVGDIVEEEKLIDLLTRETETEGEDTQSELMDRKKLYKFLFGAGLVYILASIWVYTTVHFMVTTLNLKCSNKGEGNLEKCEEIFGGYACFVHNITFGLITAVVIQQLGESSDSETNLYSKFLPIYQIQVKRLKEHKYEHHLITGNQKWKFSNISRRLSLWKNTVAMWVILRSARFYVFMWIGLGAASLIFGFVKELNASNPIFTTGQTWLGIAITIGYTYFGLNDGTNTATNNENMKNMVNQAIGPSNQVSKTDEVENESYSLEQNES